MPQSPSRSRVLRAVGAAILTIAGLAAYGAVALNTLRNGRTTFEEVGYLIRSWWYATATTAPYTATDATWHMPLYYYVLGLWQSVAGIGHQPARILSVILGAAGAGLLFAICRRLTGNVLASGAAVLLYLATPATAYAFSMATPTALVAFLHLLAMWLLVDSLGRPRTWATVLFGIICVAIFFTAQNLLPGIVFLCVLYIAAIGRDRGAQGALLGGSLAVGTAILLLSFPTRLGAHALRLPLLAPNFARWGLLPPDFGLIQQGTTGATPVLPGITGPDWTAQIDTFVLPFAGTIILAALLFLVTGRSLRILWLTAVYFFSLALAHIVASASYCNGCMIGYTPSFAASGALAGALALAALASLARRKEGPGGAVIVVGALLAAALSTFAPVLARDAAYRYFPAAQLAQPLPQDELSEIEDLARWLKTAAPAHEPILLLHDDPALPYAAFLSGATFPVQSIDPTTTHRVIKPRISGVTREAVQAAVEAQSLWSDETLQRWLARDYEVVLFEQQKDRDQTALVAALNQAFDVLATHPFRGRNLTLYRRKPVQ